MLQQVSNEDVSKKCGANPKRIQTLDWALENGAAAAVSVVEGSHVDNHNPGQYLLIVISLPGKEPLTYLYNGDSLMSIWAMWAMGGKLYTVWSGPSCSVTPCVIFVYDGIRPWIALSVTSRNFPEMVNTEDAESILITVDEPFLESEGKLFQRPKYAKLYVDRGSYFEYLGEVPWKQRMQHATGELALPMSKQVDNLGNNRGHP